MHHIELVTLLQYDLLHYFVFFLVAYVVFVNAVRFQRKRDLHRRYGQYTTRESLKTMTGHDAWTIQKEFLQLEFPFMALKSLQFALFRVCCPLPSPYFIHANGHRRTASRLSAISSTRHRSLPALLQHSSAMLILRP